MSITKKFLKSKPICKVTFKLQAEEAKTAKTALLLGDFNDWNPTVIPFRQDRDGAWRVELDLPANRRFRFHYLVDGQARVDFYADAWSLNERCVQECILETTTEKYLTTEPSKSAAVA